MKSQKRNVTQRKKLERGWKNGRKKAQTKEEMKEK